MLVDVGATSQDKILTEEIAAGKFSLKIEPLGTHSIDTNSLD